MRLSRRLRVHLAVETQRFAAIVALRAAQAESIRKQRPSFRPLSEAETLLAGELLAALSRVRRHA